MLSTTDPLQPLPADLPPSLRERWYAWRDRRIASSTFQRWAARFPLTRPIAQRRARALFDVVAGFVYSQILLACLRLHLFEILADGPQTTAALAPRLGLGEDAAARLLAAAASLGLVEKRAAGWALGPLGAPLVGDVAITAMVEHHAALYADLRDPVALLRGEPGSSALASYWPYAGAEAPGALAAERVAEYSALMGASQPMVANEVLDAYALSRHRCLLDVGGGEGVFLRHVAERAPHLQLKLFDLPAVAERAKTRFAELGLAARTQTYGGSFWSDPLPQGADIATLVRVCFDHDDAGVLKILRAVRRALPEDGTLLLAEPMSETPGAEAMGSAYFGFYLMAMGRGRSRSAEQHKALLEAAGFDRVRLLRNPMPLYTRVLSARCAPHAENMGGMRVDTVN